ncbi:MAG: transporter substrate-binding domain-containing protein, partial [Blautia sp.]|nr:transporter substrate-binding domain-containing protein [Blautia sp.]
LFTGVIAEGKTPITTLDDLHQPDLKIGVELDTPESYTLEAEFPEAKFIPYSNVLLAYADVVNGRLDACVYARKAMQLAIDNGVSGVRLLDEDYSANRVGVGISPVTTIPDFTKKLNTFIAELHADGTLDDMYERWVIRGDETMPDIPQAENPSFTLKVGTTGSVMPYTYYVGTTLTGYDIELAHRFAAYLGAKLELKVFDFGGIVAAANSGNIDCIMSNLYVTEERADSVPFSDILFEDPVTVMVKAEEESEGSDQAASPASLKGRTNLRIGVETGTISGEVAQSAIPDATISYFSSQTDVLAALRGGKVDAWASDEPSIRYVQLFFPELQITDQLDTSEMAAVFAKTEAGEALCKEFSDFVDELWADGTMEEIRDTWFTTDEEKCTVLDYEHLPDTNGTLRMAVETSLMPFAYVKDNRVVGYEVDIAARFCEAKGYRLEMASMNFDGVLPAVQTGKCDFSACGITITEERAESVLFSSPTYHSGTVLAVMEKGEVNASGAVHWKDYNGKTLGVLTGPLMEGTAKEYFPDSEYLVFDTYPDCIVALLSGKVDAYLADEQGVKATHAQQPEIDYIHDYITQNDLSFAFRKNDEKSAALCEELNAFLAKSWEDGTMQELDDIWYGIDEERKIVDMSDLTGENGTLKVVTTSTDMPFSYIKDGKNVGYDIDLVVRFCRERGYGLELGDVDFAGPIPAISSGKYDFTTDMNVTPERQEQVLFSSPTSYGGIVLAVRASDLEGEGVVSAVASSGGEQEGIWPSIYASFEKTFLRESRWKLFVQGVAVTLLITLLSILFGTALGFGVFMLCRNGNPAANLITRFCLWLVQGMPMVVLL